MGPPAVALLILIGALVTIVIILVVVDSDPKDSDGGDDNNIGYPMGQGLDLKYQITDSFGSDVDRRVSDAAQRVRDFLSNAIASYSLPGSAKEPAVFKTYNNTVSISPMQGSGLAYASPATAQIMISGASLQSYSNTTFNFNGRAETLEFVVILHETLHLLYLTGIGTYENLITVADVAGKHKFDGPNALNALNNLLAQCNESHSKTVSYVALEDDGGAGTEFYHVDENNEWHSEIQNCRVLRNDITSGYLGNTSHFTSFTLALLEDHDYIVTQDDEVKRLLGIFAGEQQACAEYTESECN